MRWPTMTTALRSPAYPQLIPILKKLYPNSPANRAIESLLTAKDYDAMKDVYLEFFKNYPDA